VGDNADPKTSADPDAFAQKVEILYCEQVSLKGSGRL